MGEGNRSLLTKKTSMSKSKFTSLLSTLHVGSALTLATAKPRRNSLEEHAEGLKSGLLGKLAGARRRLSGIDPKLAPAPGVAKGAEAGKQSRGTDDDENVEAVQDAHALERHLSSEPSHHATGPANGGGATDRHVAEAAAAVRPTRRKRTKAEIKAAKARKRREAVMKAEEEVDSKVEKGLSTSRQQLKEIRQK